MKKTDQILQSFTAWKDATTWLGIVDVELPSFESLTETLRGAGVMGESTIPVVGHFGPQTLKINWRTISPESAQLSEPKVHTLDFRGNQQIFDPLNGYIDQEVAVKTRCVSINYNPGKLAIGSFTETANEFEVHYIKIIVDGKVQIEYDKYNSVLVINGVDVMANARKNLGL